MPRHKITTHEAHALGRHPIDYPRKTCKLCADRALSFSIWQKNAVADDTICRSCMRNYKVPSLGMCETCMST
jgi:hypothetical protein